AGALLGIEIGFDLGDRFHIAEIEPEGLGDAPDLLDRRADRNVPERIEHGVGRLLGRRHFGKGVIGEKVEVLLGRRGGGAGVGGVGGGRRRIGGGVGGGPRQDRWLRREEAGRGGVRWVGPDQSVWVQNRRSAADRRRQRLGD